MKKILLSAVMLTALSFASFADEVKVKEVKNTEGVKQESEINKEKTQEPEFTGGQTTCGQTYMLCTEGQGPWTAEESWIIYSNENQRLCGELPY